MFRRVSGDGYRHGHDIEKIVGEDDGLWDGLHHHFKVSKPFLMGPGLGRWERSADAELVAPCHVACCSRHPDELYKNGLQRGSFEPCIDMIKNKFQVIDLDSKTGKSYGPCPFPRQLSMRQKV